MYDQRSLIIPGLYASCELISTPCKLCRRSSGGAVGSTAAAAGHGVRRAVHVGAQRPAHCRHRASGTAAGGLQTTATTAAAALSPAAALSVRQGGGVLKLRPTKAAAAGAGIRLVCVQDSCVIPGNNCVSFCSCLGSVNRAMQQRLSPLSTRLHFGLPDVKHRSCLSE